MGEAGGGEGVVGNQDLILGAASSPRLEGWAARRPPLFETAEKRLLTMRGRSWRRMAGESKFALAERPQPR
jgi:hypothetical protein